MNADRTTLLRLALRRAVIDQRTGNLPVHLPAAWAALGETEHAEAVANSLTDPARRAKAHALIADPPQRRDRPGPGGRDRALQAARDAGLIRPPRLPVDAPAKLVYEAEDELRHLHSDWERAAALAEIFDALVRLDDPDRARSLARGWMRPVNLNDPETWAAYLPMLCAPWNRDA